MLRWLAALCGIVTLLAASRPAVAQTTSGTERGSASGETAAGSLDADVTAEMVVEPDSFSAAVTLSYAFTNSSGLTHAGFFERLPPGAVLSSAVMGDSPVTVNADVSDERYLSLGVAFDEPLAPGATLEGRIEYTVRYPGDVAGLEHVSPGLIAIAPVAPAHGSGAADLTVRIPESFRLLTGEGWEASYADSLTVLSAVAPEPYAPIRLVAEHPEALVRLGADVPALDVALAALLPGSPALGVIEHAAQAVVELTGLASARPIEIRHGWPGESAYRLMDDPAGSVVVVLPSADEQTYAAAVALELLRGIDFADESLLADTAWAVAGRAVNGQSSNPRAVLLGTGAGPWAAPLRAALATLPSASAGDVFALLAGGDISYPGSVGAQHNSPLDWRRMLDVLENLGGVDAAADFAAAGQAVDGAVAAEIEQRAAARVDYRLLEERADGWSLPLHLRLPLDEWRFADYWDRRDAVQDLIEGRDELAAAAAEAGLTTGPHLRFAFEGAEGDLDEPQQVLGEQLHALDAVAEAQALATTDRGVLAGIGLMDYDSEASLAAVLALWEAGKFSAAEHEAEALIETYEGAVGRGTLRIAIPLAGLVAAVLLARWLWQRRPRTTTGQAEPSDAAAGRSEPG